MAAEEKDHSQENKERMLFALALMMIPQYTEFNGLNIDLEKIKTVGDLPVQVQTRANQIYIEKELKDKVEIKERLPEQQIVKTSSQVANQVQNIKYFKIVTAGDDRVCPNCAKWQGQIVTYDKVPGYKTVDDFIDSKGLHPNCRCAILPIETDEIELKAPNPRASMATRMAHPEAYNSEQNFILCFN